MGTRQVPRLGGEHERLANPLAASPIKIVDLTGAGDLFASGFLNGYINKSSIDNCLEQGTEMSAKVIQIFGARM